MSLKCSLVQSDYWTLRWSDSWNAESSGEVLNIVAEGFQFFVSIESSQEVNELFAGSFLYSEGNNDSSVQETANEFHVGFEHASGGQGWSSESDTTWSQGWFIADNAVLVCGNVRQIQNLFNFGAGEAMRSKIPHHKMGVGTVADQFLSFGHQSSC